MNNPIILTEKKVRGSFAQVYNKGKTSLEAPIYYHLHVDGVDYLITPNELERPRDRAKRNKEDLVDIRGFWEKIVDKIFG